MLYDRDRKRVNCRKNAKVLFQNSYWICNLLAVATTLAVSVSLILEKNAVQPTRFLRTTVVFKKLHRGNGRFHLNRIVTRIVRGNDQHLTFKYTAEIARSCYESLRNTVSVKYKHHPRNRYELWYNATIAPNVTDDKDA